MKAERLLGFHYIMIIKEIGVGVSCFTHSEKSVFKLFQGHIYPMLPSLSAGNYHLAQQSNEGK